MLHLFSEMLCGWKLARSSVVR